MGDWAGGWSQSGKGGRGAFSETQTHCVSGNDRVGGLGVRENSALKMGPCGGWAERCGRVSPTRVSIPALPGYEALESCYSDPMFFSSDLCH